MRNFNLPDIKINRRAIAFKFPAALAALLAVDVINASPILADGSGTCTVAKTDKDYAIPHVMAEVLENTALKISGVESVVVAAYSRKDLQSADTEWHNRGLKFSVANGIRMVLETVWTKILKAAGKVIGANDFSPLTNGENFKAMGEGRGIFLKILGITGSFDDAANIKKSGNLVYTQFKADTGIDYTFKGSDYADIHGTNTANLTDLVAALNYALKNLSPDALLRYSKPEVPTGSKRDLASALNLRNSGALIGTAFVACLAPNKSDS